LNIKAREPNADLGSKLEELDRLEANVGRLSVPLAYANPLYTLRSHTALLCCEMNYARAVSRSSTKTATRNFAKTRRWRNAIAVMLDLYSKEK
jgi:hypothetical protein